MKANIPRSASEADARWKALEDFFSENVRDATGDKNYDVRTAHQVLFYEEIKTTATSPKIKVRDAWNEVWTTKPGDEGPSEVLTNRIAIALGAKFTDLTYQVKHTDMLMILPENVSDILPNAPAGTTHRQALVKALLTSGYQYNINNDIYHPEDGLTEDRDHMKFRDGIITKEIYKTLPSEIKAKIPLKSILGRSFVLLNDAVVVHKPRHQVKIGEGIAIGDKWAQKDRISRESFVLQGIYGNCDAKDDNSHSFTIRFPKGKRPKVPGWKAVPVGNKGESVMYGEYTSDTGNSMGTMWAAGDFAALMGLDLLSVRAEADGSQSVRLNEAFLYFPKTWHMDLH